MEPTDMEIEKQVPVEVLPCARSYQVEALEMSLRQNTMVFLETGSGKTLIAIMLLRNYAYLLRKPSPFFAVFLVPQVVLVEQQAAALKMHTDLLVGMYWGEMGIDFWDAATWQKETEEKEVLVMTPQILLNCLRHSFFKLNEIKVLIIDECHHARGKHPYACIMREFYHRLLSSNNFDLPRILGMTASPIKSKCEPSNLIYWRKINELEMMMNSKVYTCSSESVLAEFVPFSTPKFKLYKNLEIYSVWSSNVIVQLKFLEEKHKTSLLNSELLESTVSSIVKKISKISASLQYCVEDLGIWVALKAAESLACCTRTDFFSWKKLNIFGAQSIKSFCLEASEIFTSHTSSGANLSIGDDLKSSLDAGILTAKVVCLIECLLEYRELEDIRCIIFVERVIASVVLQSLLDEVLPKYCSWKTNHIAGNNSGLQAQTRQKQNEIVEQFRKGMVNLIVATSILEEGLDVQTCNLVIRFDPCATVCSFIQSRGRARKQNSDYVLMLESGDSSTHSRQTDYLSSGNLMRKESLRHASDPCPPLKEDFDEEFYRVERTGAIVTLSSSIQLIHFYCSRLPSDGYFKPSPRCDIDNDTETCVLQLPKSCPIQTIKVQGHIKTLKNKAFLEACKQLHHVGALTDNLVPDLVVEGAAMQKLRVGKYIDEKPCYFPYELVSKGSCESSKKYYCYLVELAQNFTHDISIQNFILLLGSELEIDIRDISFPLETNRGALTVNFKDMGFMQLTQDQAHLCRKFQVTLFRVLMDRGLNREINDFESENNLEVNYFLLPCTSKNNSTFIDLATIESVKFSYENAWELHVNCFLGNKARVVQTQSGLVCSCLIENSLICTPHNGHVYCITGTLNELNGKSLLTMRDGRVLTYERYYKERHGVELCYSHQPFLKGRHIPTVQNCLDSNRLHIEKDGESRSASVELPPELCCILLSPISMTTFYSFSFIPSIMHRIESLLIAGQLKKMQLDLCALHIHIPTIKILEAITTKKCRENINLELLEVIGDSFLKYAACEYLFKAYPSDHEGLLSIKKEATISNATLCKLACNCKLPGFIRNECFNPKTWLIPGDTSESAKLMEDTLLDNNKIYVRGKRNMKSKVVADVVEAMIGVYYMADGKNAAFMYMDSIGIKVKSINVLPRRHLVLDAEKLINIQFLENLLNYKFNDKSLLVEALTHGSYMLPEIPTCYQRLEFLGDGVLDHLITMRLVSPGMSPGLVTDMRSASVNNDCYALVAIKAGLHKHILHCSQDLHKHIVETLDNFEAICSSGLTYGWDTEASLPKVLGDVIESLAGAIHVDSGYNDEIVWKSIGPLLGPMVTPDTVRIHPVRELNELCNKNRFILKKTVRTKIGEVAATTIQVEANGQIYQGTSTALDKELAKKLAAKEVLKRLKEDMAS